MLPIAFVLRWVNYSQIWDLVNPNLRFELIEECERRKSRLRKEKSRSVSGWVLEANMLSELSGSSGSLGDEIEVVSHVLVALCHEQGADR